MRFEQFAPVFGMLAIQLRAQDADDATARSYHAAMRDLEPEFVAMAADRFAKGASLNDQGEAWFPKAPEWRAMAAKVEAERRDAQRAMLRKLRSPLCLACSDTGWAHDADQRAYHCECRKLRRLELLGVRPWPTLAIGSGDTGDGPLTPAASLAVIARLREQGLQPRIRVVREPLRSRLGRRDDAAKAVPQADADEPAL